MERKNITMEKIAKELNISRKTVYRALYNLPQVSKETRESVLSLVEKYDYHPNITAQSLAKKKTGTIGMLVENIAIPIRIKLAQYIVRLMNLKSYQVILKVFDNYSIDSFIDNFQTDFLGKRIDGLIITSDPVFIKNETLHKVIEKMWMRKFPLIFLSDAKNWEGIEFVSTDYFLGSYESVNHLIQLGHTKIAFINDDFNRQSLQLRFEGYKKALYENGLELNDEMLILIKGPEYGNGYEAGCYISQMQEKPSAVLCLNDIAAIGMLKAFQQNGIKVPQDIALVGFDNIDASAYASVPLTTVEQPVQKLAGEGVRMLLDRIHNPFIPEKHIYLRPKLIVRESCGAHLK